jgi:hypothetical protein
MGNLSALLLHNGVFIEEVWAFLRRIYNTMIKIQRREDGENKSEVDHEGSLPFELQSTVCATRQDSPTSTRGEISPGTSE